MQMHDEHLDPCEGSMCNTGLRETTGMQQQEFYNTVFTYQTECSRN